MIIRNLLSLSAVVILASSMQSQSMAADPGILIASTKDQALIDASGDGKANIRGSVQAVEGRVGENKQDSDEVRYCLSFLLNENDIAAILAGPVRQGRITLNISLAAKLNTKHCRAALIGLPDRKNDAFTVNDFHVEGVVVDDSCITDDLRGGEYVAIDVGDFAKQELERGSRIVAFRIELRPQFPVFSDGKPNRFLFSTADSPNPPFLRFNR